MKITTNENRKERHYVVFFEFPESDIIETKLKVWINTKDEIIIVNTEDNRKRDTITAQLFERILIKQKQLSQFQNHGIWRCLTGNGMDFKPHIPRRESHVVVLAESYVYIIWN